MNAFVRLVEKRKTLIQLDHKGGYKWKSKNQRFIKEIYFI